MLLETLMALNHSRKARSAALASPLLIAVRNATMCLSGPPAGGTEGAAIAYLSVAAQLLYMRCV